MAPLGYLLRLLTLVRLLLRLGWSIYSWWRISHCLSRRCGGRCYSVCFLLLDCDGIISVKDGPDVEYMRETFALEVVSRFCIIFQLKPLLFILCTKR